MALIYTHAAVSGAQARIIIIFFLQTAPIKGVTHMKLKNEEQLKKPEGEFWLADLPMLHQCKHALCVCIYACVCT